MISVAIIFEGAASTSIVMEGKGQEVREKLTNALHTKKVMYLHEAVSPKFKEKGIKDNSLIVDFSKVLCIAVTEADDVKESGIVRPNMGIVKP